MIRPTFYGMEIAKTGLFMSQLGMDVTAHNIANVDTPGYTRQRVVTQSIDPYNALYRLKPLNTYKVGGGVELKILDQIRDEFLDMQFRNGQSDYSMWATRAQGLRYIEPLYDEFSGGGPLRIAITDLFNAFSELTRNPSDREPREVTRQAAITMIDAFQQTYTNLLVQRDVQNQTVMGTAEAINDITDQITLLNKAINNYEFDNPMHMANDLRDKRNLLLDQLSALIDIEYSPKDGYVNVTTAGGLVLVDGLHANKIVPVLDDDPITGEAGNYYRLFLVDPDSMSTKPADIDPADPTTFLKELNIDNVKGGELAGHFQLRDREDAANPGIPYFMKQLNILAGAIVTEINKIHREGWTFPGSENGILIDSHTGVDFFVPFDAFGSPPDIICDSSGKVNFKISDEILASVWNIACSDEEIVLLDSETAKGGNNKIALLLSDLINSTTLDNVGNIFGFMTTVTVEVAGAIKKADSMAGTMGSNLLNLDNNRTSISGVSLDEEMTNMIKYQHSYDASARMITTMDEMLETLINRMGVVGR
ncbi:MAG: flagellar hook-associated protein FlgK [Clostridiales bacterium]|nr:flagellar hook-associated protein FlgK [Clostridiales bacterium]